MAEISVRERLNELVDKLCKDEERTYKTYAFLSNVKHARFMDGYDVCCISCGVGVEERDEEMGDDPIEHADWCPMPAKLKEQEAAEQALMQRYQAIITKAEEGGKE
jgi:hypothetical protein